jgi:beta-phosphoglucomutase-like phosphatase (HAD superfamily)
MVDAVLLEWEGVLADTRHARRDALRHAMAAEGVAHTLSDDDPQLRGLGVSASVRTVLRHMGSSDATLAELLAVRAARAFADALASGIVLAPGAAAFIARMQSRARVAIVTRASRAETELMLGMAGLQDAVTMIVSADDVTDEAPTAALFRLAMDRLARTRVVEPARAVAIVDAAPGIRAARAAGARVLVVGAPAHHAMEADAAVDALDDVTLDDWIVPVPPHGHRGRA